MAAINTRHKTIGGGVTVEYVALVNAAGEEISPATSALVSNLDFVVSAVFTATITATATLATAFSTTLPADLVRIVLIPRGDVYWAVGEAAAVSTSLIGQGSFLSIPVTKTFADTIQIFSAGAGADVDLLVCTPR